jgi:hypothetical protein
MMHTMNVEQQNQVLLAACEAALRRIERLNVGTEELGPDPTVVQLKRAIRNAKKTFPAKKRGSSTANTKAQRRFQ